MDLNSIIQAIDTEIARLKQVRSLLAGSEMGTQRPNKQEKATSFEYGHSAPAKKRKSGMSAEGRKRIAEAQRKRWAAVKAAKSKGK